MINLTLNQARSHHPLSRLTKFNRIELASSSDPLNGNFMLHFYLHIENLFCALNSLCYSVMLYMYIWCMILPQFCCLLYFRILRLLLYFGKWILLSGLYIGAHGLYTSEIIQLKRKFGQWKEDNGTKVPSNLEFYEYVEATKITGDPYVPAGQVTF